MAQGDGRIITPAYGPLFKFCRVGVRLFMGKYASDVDDYISPAVYICRHGNQRGPMAAMANLPIHVRLWALSPFLERKTCYEHYSTITFQDRYKWSKAKAKIVSFFIAAPFARLVRSLGAIPVYRRSLEIKRTLRISVDALAGGDSVLLFPDVNFIDTEQSIGELYPGFLTLEKMYYARENRHLAFIPLHISKKNRRLYTGQPISFSDNRDFNSERNSVLLQLTEELNRMRIKYGD